MSKNGGEVNNMKEYFTKRINTAMFIKGIFIFGYCVCFLFLLNFINNSNFLLKINLQDTHIFSLSENVETKSTNLFLNTDISNGSIYDSQIVLNIFYQHIIVLIILQFIAISLLVFFILKAKILCNDFKENEKYLSLAVERNKFTVFEWNYGKDKSFTWLNDFYTPKSPINISNFRDDIEIYIHTEDRELVKNTLVDVFDNGIDLFDIVYRFESDENSYVVTNIIGNVNKRDNKGKPTNIIGFLRDVTDIERKKYDARRIEKMYSILNHYNSDCIILTVNNKITDINNAGLNLFDIVNDQDVFGKEIHELLLKGIDKNSYEYIERHTFIDEGEYKSVMWDIELVPGKTSFITIEKDDSVFNDEKISQYIIKNTFEDHEDPKTVDQLMKYDTLTKLYRRNAFKVAMSKKLPSLSCAALILFDIVQFKKINELYGLDTGDALLKKIALIIKSLGDYLSARVSGDKFAILISNTKDEISLNEIFKKIIDEIREYQVFLQQGEDIIIACGAVVYPNEADDCETLFYKAEIAINHSRTLNESTMVVYHSEMDDLYKGNYIKLKEISRGLTNNEFDLEYQAVHCKDKNTISTVEALARWNHPKLGYLYPKSFIDDVENSKLVCEFGLYIIEKCFVQMNNWIRQGIAVNMSINISVHQLYDTEFSNKVTKLIDKHRINGSRVIFEITERSIVLDHSKIAGNLTALNKLGIKFSIDDFGVEYSSLARLSSLHYHYIKIDKGFVSKIYDNKVNAIIIKMIMDLSSYLNIGVIAEGVEEKEELDTLQDLGCNNYQGFYFYKPMKKDKITEVLLNVHNIK